MVPTSKHFYQVSMYFRFSPFSYYFFKFFIFNGFLVLIFIYLPQLMHASIYLRQQITLRVLLLLLWTVLLFWQHMGSVRVQCLSCTAPILNMQMIPWLLYKNTEQREGEGKKSKRGFCDCQDSDVMCLAKAMIWKCPRSGMSC